MFLPTSQAWAEFHEKSQWQLLLYLLSRTLHPYQYSRGLSWHNIEVKIDNDPSLSSLHKLKVKTLSEWVGLRSVVSYWIHSGFFVVGGAILLCYVRRTLGLSHNWNETHRNTLTQAFICFGHANAMHPRLLNSSHTDTHTQATQHLLQ